MYLIIRIQNFFKLLGQTLESLIKIVLLSRLRIVRTKESKSNCLIIGNGPSLNISLSKINFDLHTFDIYCVNNFVFTDLYKSIKPNYYVLTDPILWLPGMEEESIRNRETLFNALSKNTNWKMTILIPFDAKKYSPNWRSIVKDNPFILINYFNNTPINGWNFIKHSLFSLGLGLPRPHNVLIACIYLAIQSAHEKVYIIGADHGWLKELSVTDNNEVLMNRKHFYQTQGEQKNVLLLGKKVKKLHEVLQSYHFIFLGYHELNYYSKKKKCKIYNATPNSYIDAFDRIEESLIMPNH